MNVLKSCGNTDKSGSEALEDHVGKSFYNKCLLYFSMTIIVLN